MVSFSVGFNRLLLLQALKMGVRNDFLADVLRLFNVLHKVLKGFMVSSLGEGTQHGHNRKPPKSKTCFWLGQRMG